MRFDEVVPAAAIFVVVDDVEGIVHAEGTGEGSTFDTLLGVYTGNVVSGLSLVADDDDSGAGTTSLVTFTAVLGTVYQIAVDGFAGASGSIVNSPSSGPSLRWSRSRACSIRSI